MTIPMNSRILAAGCTIVALLLFTVTVNRYKPTTRTLSHLGLTSKGSEGSLQNVHNATLGFQKIFAISLPARTDHRDALTLAAHLTGLQVEFRDGITHVDPKALPPGGEEYTTKGALGAWRAHMDVLQEMAAKGITTALIMEDDTDWDIRIKSQMETFARASRLLLQPQLGSTEVESTRSFSEDISTMHEHNAEGPFTSPYADIDDWDILWIGHCGAKTPSVGGAIPSGRFAIVNDETVPEKQHVFNDWSDNELTTDYPDHTRLVSRSYLNVCSLAYAVSLPGARKILYELGIRRNDKAFDSSLSDMCDGRFDRPMLNCLTVRPQLFSHHRPIARKSSFSNIETGISDGDGGKPAYSTVAYSRNIRWSTKGNFRQLVYGDTNYTDLFVMGSLHLTLARESSY